MVGAGAGAGVGACAVARAGAAAMFTKLLSMKLGRGKSSAFAVGFSCAHRTTAGSKEENAPTKSFLQAATAASTASALASYMVTTVAFWTASATISWIVTLLIFLLYAHTSLSSG